MLFIISMSWGRGEIQERYGGQSGSTSFVEQEGRLKARMIQQLTRYAAIAEPMSIWNTSAIEALYRAPSRCVTVTTHKVMEALISKNMLSSVLRGHSKGSSPEKLRISRIGQKRRMFQLSKELAGSAPKESGRHGKRRRDSDSRSDKAKEECHTAARETVQCQFCIALGRRREKYDDPRYSRLVARLSLNRSRRQAAQHRVPLSQAHPDAASLTLSNNVYIA